MSVNKSEKQELLEKLNELLQKQSQFQQEISDLERRIINLSISSPQAQITQQKEQTQSTQAVSEKKEVHEKVHPLLVESKNKTKQSDYFEKKLKEISLDWEKFIGENLISKIGIAVLIIGVGIGAKYAIDNNLISPLMRILLGYLVGFVLNFLAFKLKKNYYNFSAVLASGAMAIHYFITYAAYTYYSLFPNVVAFVLMVVITVLTVVLALYYNRQVIAHIGMAGAYIIPFLLSDPDSSVIVLLIYMAIINCGILFISTKKRWKPLNYLTLVATWSIFMSWFLSGNYNNELGLSLIFSSIFFVTFYLVFLSYKLILKEKLQIDDIEFLLLNSGMFYLVGMIALNTAGLFKEYAGLFTVINAALHGFTAFLVYRSEQKDKHLFYWAIGLVVTFFTVAIPIQFKNVIILILWSAEAAILFWYSRKVKIKFYEISSLIIVLGVFGVFVSNLSFGSYNFYTNEIETITKPILNSEFLASVCAATSLLFIFFLNKKETTEKNLLTNTESIKILFSIVLLLILYLTFYSQINLYWNNVQIYSAFELNSSNIWMKQFDNLNQDIFRMKSIWIINYSIVFTFLLSLLNVKWFKDSAFKGFLLVAHYIIVLIFLTVCLDILSELRNSYLDPSANPRFDVSILHILIRYVAYIFFVLLMFSLHHYVNPLFDVEIINKIFDVIFSITLIWLLSSELINWLSISGSTELYKHGLSILWGIFSLLLVAYGIWKKKKHLRITAFVLFGITLIKLFFFDMSNLKTIPKTIVFVVIGAFLLMVSYLYNKYKHSIFEEN